MSAGILAVFPAEAEWAQARAQLLAAGLGPIEAYSPAPAADERGDSPLPGWIAAAGLLGAAGGFLMQVYADTVAYPLNIGGRPNFSWPAFIPIAFEIGALCAVLTAFFGFFIVNRLPRLYDPIDGCEGMRDAMRCDWVLAVRGSVERLNQARAILGRSHPKLLEDVPA